MPKSTDVRPIASTLYLLPVATRMPLKFGAEVTTEVTCARVRLTVQGRDGKTADGGAAPAGLYFASAVTDGQRASCKVALLR